MNLHVAKAHLLPLYILIQILGQVYSRYCTGPKED